MLLLMVIILNIRNNSFSKGLTMYGKQLRLERLKNKTSGKFLFIAMDHGISYGIQPGLEDMGNLIRQVGEGGAEAVILHKGNVKNIVYAKKDYLEPFSKGLGLIMHLNGAPSIGSNPYIKIPLCTVAEAVQYGADAVSLHVSVGDEGDEEMIEFLGEISSDCLDWGMPLIAMIYPRGPNIDEYDAETISHCVRLGVELGADIIKTNYPGDIDSFKKICESCPIPIVVAGGPQQKKLDDFYITVSDIMSAGASGMAVGRNVFGTTNPTISTQILSDLIHKRLKFSAIKKKYSIPEPL
jgi:fructose-bisphosphate aldolase / 2-amino-3,7-dideoxy-D-threo-hept-6-ulosonate synthase